MLRLLRIGILLLMFLMAMSVLMATGAAEAGPFERIVLAGGLVLLFALNSRRLCQPSGNGC